MASEQDRKPPAKRVPRAPYRDDGFIVYEAGGYDKLTPEQKLWPVVSLSAPAPTPPLAPPPTAPDTPPSPPG